MNKKNIYIFIFHTFEVNMVNPRYIVSTIHLYGVYVVLSANRDLELLGSLVLLMSVLGGVVLFVKDINIKSIDRILPTIVHVTLFVNYRETILSSYTLLILLLVSVINDYLFSRFRIVIHHALSRILIYFIVHLTIF